MGKRSILLYWMLILVPAVVISAAAFRLIYHEQERINGLAVASIEDRTETIGDTLQITVEAVEEELSRALLNIPEDKLQDTLLEWVDTNPLVRNVFIWDDNSGLRYPVSGMASTSEERHFISRFDGLFSGRVSWSSSESAASDDQKNNKSSSLLKDVSLLNRSKSELVEIAQNYNSSISKKPDSQEANLSSGGWIPWFAENRLYILGWTKKREDSPVYGVELELMTLLSRLIGNFPQVAPGQPGYALVDDSGRLLHQAGDIKIDKETIPLLRVPLEPHLPHWSLAVYLPDNRSTGAGNKFMVLALLLLFIFIAAIAAGGFLLMRNARQNMIDAQQKTSFVSNVSHELKTPLTSIRMFAELLLEGRVRDQEKKHKYLSVIVSESRRLTRLVNNVLDFSRLEQGQKKYHFEELDIGTFLRNFMEFHSPRIKDAGMESFLSIPDEETLIKTDRDALEQVILNLVDNAVKYANEGKEISVSLNRNINNIKIRVEDRGPGVPESQRKKIFEKFHRVDDSLTARTQGSGLGLSIARRMLQDMGGDLYYEPGLEGGSSFIAMIPVDPCA